METHIPPESPVIQWHAPQHLHYERGLIWYIVSGAFVLACIIYGIVSGGWLFSILIAAIAGIHWKTHGKPSRERRMRIWKRGFALDEDFTEWKDCAGYWMLRTPAFSQLTIERKRGGPVHILLGEVNPFTLHEVLPAFVEELPDHKERLLDIILRICKI